MQIQCLTADNVESAAPDHAAMTTSLKSFSGNWFIIKDNLNYAMVIAFDDISRWGGGRKSPFKQLDAVRVDKVRLKFQQILSASFFFSSMKLNQNLWD